MTIAATSMSSVLEAIRHEAWSQGTPFLMLGFVVTALLLRTIPDTKDVRSRMRFVAFLLGMHVLVLPITGACAAFGAGVTRDLRLIGAVGGAIAGVGLVGLFVFDLLTPRLRVKMPRIMQDVLVAIIAIVAVFGTASRAGMNLTGIVATGAALTAVIGLALQDTLGNVLGGLSVQLDSSVRVGDWIRVQEITGRVVEIRWRSTSIETRNWETVVIPNSVLTKTQVTVLGRRVGQDPRWRRWVYFNVDFRYTPSLVIELALQAIRAQPIENVATEPEPTCVLMDFSESYCRYAIRYFLYDFGPDDVTDSVVRTRLYFALTRAGIPLSIPAHSVFITEDSKERRVQKAEAEEERRVAALARIDLFKGLSDEERVELATSLHRAPFARGETLTREGADAHHLYIIDRGDVSVRAREGNHEREVNQLHRGQFFGEMSLLTGEKRAATVVALTDVECYRLDADAFRRLLARRPDLAASVAEKLADRRVELVATREELADRKSLVQQDQLDLLHKIREFFRL